MRVEHRSGKDDWQTPEDTAELVRAFAPIGLDPCTDESNPMQAVRFFTIDDDGLVAEWIVSQGEIVWCNPPYSESKRWLRHLAEQASRGFEIVALVACRPCTRYWDQYVWPHARGVCFIRGRLTFRGAENPAPFESCLLYYGGRFASFEKHFEPIGKVVRVRG